MKHSFIEMKKTKLGEFEEHVLLTVAVLQQEAYGVEIKRDLEDRLKENLSVGSVQSTLKRMEDKGFLTSTWGNATELRGGKRKRIYSATPYARRLLAEAKEINSNRSSYEFNTCPPLLINKVELQGHS